MGRATAREMELVEATPVSNPRGARSSDKGAIHAHPEARSSFPGVAPLLGHGEPPPLLRQTTGDRRDGSAS
jgi:hypothetical protein